MYTAPTQRASRFSPLRVTSSSFDRNNWQRFPSSLQNEIYPYYKQISETTGPT